MPSSRIHSEQVIEQIPNRDLSNSNTCLWSLTLCKEIKAFQTQMTIISGHCACSDRRREGSPDGGTQLSYREGCSLVGGRLCGSHSAWVPASPHLHTDKRETFAVWLHLSVPRFLAWHVAVAGTWTAELLWGFSELPLKVLTAGSVIWGAGHKCLLLLLLFLIQNVTWYRDPSSSKKGIRTCCWSTPCHCDFQNLGWTGILCF